MYLNKIGVTVAKFSKTIGGPLRIELSKVTVLNVRFHTNEHISGC